MQRNKVGIVYRFRFDICVYMVKRVLYFIHAQALTSKILPSLTSLADSLRLLPRNMHIGGGVYRRVTIHWCCVTAGFGVIAVCVMVIYEHMLGVIDII